MRFREGQEVCGSHYGVKFTGVVASIRASYVGQDCIHIIFSAPLEFGKGNSKLGHKTSDVRSGVVLYIEADGTAVSGYVADLESLSETVH